MKVNPQTPQKTTITDAITHLHQQLTSVQERYRPHYPNFSDHSEGQQRLFEAIASLEEILNSTNQAMTAQEQFVREAWLALQEFTETFITGGFSCSLEERKRLNGMKSYLSYWNNYCLPLLPLTKYITDLFENPKQNEYFSENALESQEKERRIQLFHQQIKDWIEDEKSERKDALFAYLKSVVPFAW